jgi:hypothetical protein
MKIFDQNIDNNIRYDLVVKYLAKNNPKKKTIETLLRDSSSIIRCEVLDWIMENNNIENYLPSIKTIYDRDDELFNKGRALISLTITDNLAEDFDITDDERYSQWIDLHRYIKYNDCFALIRLISYGFSENKSISSLSHNLLRDYAEYIDANKVNVFSKFLQEFRGH